MFLEHDRAPKHLTKISHSDNVPQILSELNSKLEIFLESLHKSKTKSLELLKQTQTSFSDTFNIDSLVKLLEVLADRMSNQDTVRCKKSVSGGQYSEAYMNLSKLIYLALYKLSVENIKSSSIIVNFSKAFSGQIELFNKEIRKLLGCAIPCAMSNIQSPGELVSEWFKLLKQLIKTPTINNIKDQLVALKILEGLCLGNDKKGNIANQRALFRQLQESSSISLGFGVDEKRPYVSFCQVDKSDKDTFLENNPVLAKHALTLGSEKEYKCVYLDDLSKSYSTTKDYVSYIDHVIRLFASMCTGRFNAGIAELVKRGLGGYHLVTCIKMGVPKLHSKLMQAYLELVRVVCIDIDPLTSIVVSPNRCYLYFYYFW